MCWAEPTKKTASTYLRRNEPGLKASVRAIWEEALKNDSSQEKKQPVALLIEYGVSRKVLPTTDRELTGCGRMGAREYGGYNAKMLLFWLRPGDGDTGTPDVGKTLVPQAAYMGTNTPRA